MALTATARVELMLSLLPWLAAHPGVAKSEAAAQFGISVAQLERILGTMFVAEIPGHPEWCIDLDFLDEDCVTVLEPQGLDRPLTLRPDEAASLILGLRHLAGLLGEDADVMLYVESDNPAARATYRGLGFQHAGSDTVYVPG